MKVLVVGQPKSGTTMLAGRIKAGLDLHYGVNSQFLFEPKINTELPKIQDHNVTKILYFPRQHHISTCEQAEEIARLFDKKVIICRDPRDIIVSGALYKWFQGHKPKQEHFEKALDLVLKKESNPSSVNLYTISSIDVHSGIPCSLEKYRDFIQEIYNQFASDVSQLQSNNWYLVKYEDIISENILGLNHYLEFEIAQDTTAITHKKAFIRTARSMAYGNWRNWFTQDDILFFRPLLENSLQKLGYMADDWKLNSVQEIDPKTSSKYMIKLMSS